jgi:sec-independent protein translocase protein TatC
MGLLTRGPQRSQGSVDDARMTVVEHLEDLRRALIIAVVAWLICSVVSWFFTVDILQFIKHRANLHNLIYLNPTGGFMIRFKIAIYTGTLLASPIIFWQAWWFVGPGLHAHEKRVVLPLIFATTAFFLMGVALCFYALPLIIHVLTGFAPPDVMQFLPNASDFLSFLLGLCIAFGLVFELPVVLWTLGMLGIISSGWLWSNRLYWVLGLGLLANIMTPGGDPLTPLVVFVPLIFFYGGSMLLLKISGR